MTDHLNQNEIHLAIEKNTRKLPRERYKHFSKCSYCQEQYKIQLTIHSSLKKLEPLPAPQGITQKVLSSLVSVSKQAMPKKKTDWVFLVALIILAGIGSWYLYNGQVGTYITDYIPQIAPQNTEVVTQSNEFLDSLKKKINSIEINFKVNGFNWRSLYVFIGLLAFIFYTVLDKKLNQLHKMRRS